MVTAHTLHRQNSNTSLSVQSMTRDLEHPYSPYQRPAGFLTHKSYAATPSQFPSGCVFHTNCAYCLCLALISYQNWFHAHLIICILSFVLYKLFCNYYFVTCKSFCFAKSFRGAFTYSDEFVQDLHLFPFYLLLR